MNISASSCNITTDSLKKFEEYFIASYKEAFNNLKEGEQLNLKTFMQGLYENIKTKVIEPSAKHEKALLSVMVGAAALPTYAYNKNNSKYFPEYIVKQLNDVPWKIAVDSSKDIAVRYLGLLPTVTVPTVAVSADMNQENDKDYEELLYEINTMNIALLFQPTNSEFYKTNDLSKDMPLSNGIKAFRKFLDYYFSNLLKDVTEKDFAVSRDFYFKLYNKKDVDSSKIYGKSNSQYVYLLVDNTGEPVSINDDGVIEDGARFFVSFYSRIPDSVIDNIDLYMDSTNDKALLDLLIKSGMVLNPIHYKTSTLRDAKEKLRDAKEKLENNPKNTKSLEDLINKIEDERSKYEQNLIATTKAIAYFIKYKVLPNPANNLIRVNNDNSRVGYIRYISKQSELIEKGPSYISDESGNVLSNITSVDYKPALLTGVRQNSKIVINGKFDVVIYPNENQLGPKNDRINPRLLPIVNTLVELMSDDTITYKGVPLTTQEKLRIFAEFYFNVIITNDSARHSLSSNEAEWSATVDNTVYKKSSTEAFKQALALSLEKASLKNPTKNFIEIPSIVQDGDSKVLVLTETKSSDYVAKYYKLPITVPQGSDTLPILNPTLALSYEEPYQITTVSSEDSTAEEVTEEPEEFWMSKSIDNLSTDKLNKKALEWFNTNPVTKNVNLQQLFNVVNSGALATWSRAGVTLYSGSQYTDLYHEAWHEFTEMWFTPDQKKMLLDEVKKIKGEVTYYYKNEKITKQASKIEDYQEVMEFLAEEYRAYAINESSSIVTKAIKAIFKKLKELLTALFGKTTALDSSINAFDNPAIREIFNQLYTGKIVDYKYYVNQGSTNVLQKTIVGVGDKKSRYKFSKDETLLLQQTMNSIVFELGIKPRKILEDSKELSFPSVRLLFRSNKIDSFYEIVEQRFAERKEIFTDLQQKATDPDLKKSYAKAATLFDVALRNLGDVAKLQDRTEKQGIIKYYIEENDFINEIYKDDTDFFDKDDGQYEDKGNNSTSIHSDFSPFLKFMLSSMPKLKILKNNTLYINKNLTEGIKKEGNKYYKVNMLTGQSEPIDKLTFDDRFNKIQYVFDDQYKVTNNDQYVERTLSGMPVTLNDSNLAINKLINTPGLIGTLKPLSIYRILHSYASKGANVSDKLFYTNMLSILGANALIKWADTKLKEENAKKFHEHVKEHFYTFNALLQALSRDKVSPIIVNIGGDNLDLTIESFIGNTDYINFWTKRASEYLDYTSKLTSKQKNIYGLINKNNQFVFNPATFFEFNEEYNPNNIENKNKVVFKYDQNTAKQDSAKIIKYLEIMGVLSSSITYPEDLVREIVEDASVINGLNAFNVVLYNIRTDTDLLGKNQDVISNPVILLKKGIASRPDLKQFTLVEKIFSIVNRLESSVNDNMYTNAKGDLENEFSLMSSMMRLVQMYNDPEFKNIIASTPEENPFIVDSFLNKVIYKNPEAAQLKLFKAGGISNETNTGVAENENNVFTATIEAMINLRLHKAYRMYQHAGASTQHYLQIGNKEILGYDEANAESKFYNRLFNYFIAESIRVKQTLRGEHAGLEMFSKYGEKYLFFNYINDEGKKAVSQIIDDVYKGNNVAEVIEAVKKQITPVEKRKIIDQISNHTRKEIDETFNQFNKIDPSVLNNIDKSINEALGNKLEGDGKKLLNHYYMNEYLFNIETNIFFYGDLANYNLDKDEFSKRNKLFGSGGNPIHSDLEYTELIKSIFSFQESENQITDLKNLPVVILNDVVTDSTNYNEYSKAIKSIISDSESAEKRASNYKGYKEADAQGVVLLPTYRMLSLASNNWDSVKEAYYNDILNGKSLPDNITEFFPSLKYQYVGPAKYKKDNKDKKIQTFSLKFNIVPLIPPVLKTQIGEVEKERYWNLVYNKMVSENIAMLTFVSGSKNTFFFDKDSNVFYDDKGDVTDKPFVKNFIDTTFFKDQLYIAPVFKEKALISSQKRTKILDQFYENGKIKDSLKKYEPLIEEYKASIKDATRIFKEKLSSKLQIDLNNPDEKSMRKFASYLQELLKKKGYITEDEADMIAVVNGKFAYDYTSSGLAFTLDGIIASIIEKNVIQQKFPGEPLIQVASTGWEFVETDPNKKRFKGNVEYNPTLLSYRTGPDGTILPAQIKIAMQGGFYKLLNLTHTDGNAIGTIPRLNEMMRIVDWKKEHMEKFIITGDRIPVHAHPSMEFLEVEEFLDPIQGNIIVLPSEIVAKSGGDFDVDKLTLLFPTFDDAGNLLKYSLTFNESKNLVKELNNKVKIGEEKSAAYYKLLRKVLVAIKKDLRNTGFENVGELANSNKTKNYSKVVNNNQEALAEYDELNIGPDETLESIEQTLEGLSEQISNIFKNKPELESKVDELTKEEKELLKVAEQYKDAVYYHKNIIGAAGNRINKNVADILSIEELFPYLILPTTDEDLKQIANSDVNVSLSEFVLPNPKKDYSYILNPFQSLLKLDYNSSGKDSLGIIAVYSSLVNEMIEAGLKLPSGITKPGSFQEIKIPFNYHNSKQIIDVFVDDKGNTKKIEIDALDYSKLKNLSGDNSLDIAGQKINASVDVEKDPWLLRLGIRKKTASLQLGLSGVGVSETPLSRFLLNPMLSKFIRFQEIQQNPLLPFFGEIKTNDQQNYTKSSMLESIISKDEFVALLKESDYDGKIKNEIIQVLSEGYSNDVIIKINNILADSSKATYENTENFNTTYYNNRLNQAVSLIHYIALNLLFAENLNKLSFALRPDRQRFASTLDFMLFDAKYDDLIDTMPEFTKEGLRNMKKNSVRSSFYIKTDSLPKFLLDQIAPQLNKTIEFIYTKHYKGKKYDSEMPFKDTKSAIKLYSNILRSVQVQKLLNARYNNDVYKGFNLLASTEFAADANAIETSVNKNDFNILKTSGVKVLEVKDAEGKVVEKSLYVNKLNIAIFSKMMESGMLPSEFYTKYGMVNPQFNILRNSNLLEKYLIEYEIARNKYPKAEFENSVYFKEVYKNIGTDTIFKSIQDANPDITENDYAYELFLRDMATIGSMPLSVLSAKAVSSSSTNIGYFINQIKVAYSNVLAQEYSVLNNIRSTIRDKSDMLEVEIFGVKDNIEHYRQQIQDLIDPTNQTLTTGFDNMILSDMLTGIGLYSLMQNNTSASASKVQQLFVNKNLLKNLATVELTDGQLKELLQQINDQVVAQNNHKKLGYIYIVSEQQSPSKNSLNIIPYRNTKTTKSTFTTPATDTTQPSGGIPTTMTLKEYADKTSARFVNTREVLRKDDIEYYNDRVTDLIEGTLKYAIFASEDLNNKQYLPFLNKLKENGFEPVKGMEYVLSKGGVNPKDEYAKLTTQPTTQLSASVKPTVKDLSRWADIKDATTPYTDNGIVVTRVGNTEEQFGNPFIGSKRRDKQGNLVKSKVDNITVFNTRDEADQAYRDWLMGTKHQNIKPKRREWILKQINEGKLDGKTLLYYKPMEVENNDGTIITGGYHSHADTLAEIVEQLRSKSITPTVEAKPTTQTLESKTELEVYIPDYNLAQSVYNQIQGRVAKGEDFITVKNEIYKRFYDNISQRYDQIPKDINFNVQYMLSPTNIVNADTIASEVGIKNILVYNNIATKDGKVDKILNGLLYINAFVLYQKFGKINKQFLPADLVAKVIVRETIAEANISEAELNKVLDVIRNC